MTELAAGAGGSDSPVVVEFPESRRARLLALRRDLQTRVGEMTRADPVFSFYVSREDTPRFWLDPVSFVSLTADGRGWSFFQGSRNARTEHYRTEEYRKIRLFCESYVRELLSFRQTEGVP